MSTATVSMTTTIRARPLEPLQRKLLDLSYIRNQLIRLEDTIVFSLIERSQYPPCEQIYSKLTASEFTLDESTFTPLPFLDHLLHGLERLHARFHRYDALDETPFFPMVAPEKEAAMSRYFPINGKIGKESSEDASTGWETKGDVASAMENWNRINYTARIRKDYATKILPSVCCFTCNHSTSTLAPLSGAADGPENAAEDSEQDVLGSAAECDIAVLQALSRRIHFGKFVAEAKFQSERRLFEKLIRRADVDGIMRAITDEGIERKVLERLALKAMVYGRDPASGSGSGRISIEGIVGMYKDWIIPLTKEVEVEYLLRRLDNEP